MGSCGCGDTQIHYQLPGPDGSIYGLEFYPGCDSCMNGPALTLHCFGDYEEAKGWSFGGQELDLASHLADDERYQYVCDHIPFMSTDVLDEVVEEQYEYLPDCYTEQMRQMDPEVFKEILKSTVRTWVGLGVYEELRLRREREGQEEHDDSA